MWARDTFLMLFTFLILCQVFLLFSIRSLLLSTKLVEKVDTLGAFTFPPWILYVASFNEDIETHVSS